MTDLWPWAIPLALLALSALFSSAETALFGLGERDGGSRVARLLASPRDTLVTILICNLVINVTYFAVVQDLGSAHPVLTGVGSLLALLSLGEILPKSLALRAAPQFARALAPPVLMSKALLKPVRIGVGVFLETAMRGLGEDTRIDKRISPQALEQALVRSAHDGEIAHGEAGLLSEIVALSSLRVREIMTPRVEILSLDLEATNEQHRVVLAGAVKARLSWLPVVRGSADNIEGMVAVRDLLADPERTVASVLMPAAFVPEVAPVLSMLSTLRAARVAEAVVVDEWGGTAGIVTLEHLFEEVVGDLRVEDEEIQKPMVALGEDRYRVAGDLSIRDWNGLLDRDVVPHEYETVGGYVFAILGRLPRVGDQVELGGGIVGEVSQVRGRRVWSVDLYVRTDASGVRQEGFV